jgi:hypothetical protein
MALMRYPVNEFNSARQASQKDLKSESQVGNLVVPTVPSTSMLLISASTQKNNLKPDASNSSLLHNQCSLITKKKSVGFGIFLLRFSPPPGPVCKK